MKPQYRIRNWSEYNAGWKQRGSLTSWIEASVLEQWVVEELSGKAGASVLYSDLAIATMATVKAIYRLAGRQCQGFLESIFELMGIDLPVPDPSTLSRRLGQLSIELPVVPKQGGTACGGRFDGNQSLRRRGMENPTAWSEQAADVAQIALGSR